jgi:hypothetical protein
MTVNLTFTQYGGTQPINLTGVTLAFIANKDLSGKTKPPVYITWTNHSDPVNGKSVLQILSGLTSTLEPGDYFFNVTALDPFGNVQTYAAGTWPITPVPGLISGAP